MAVQQHGPPNRMERAVARAPSPESSRVEPSLWQRSRSTALGVLQQPLVWPAVVQGTALMKDCAHRLKEHPRAIPNVLAPELKKLAKPLAEMLMQDPRIQRAFPQLGGSSSPPAKIEWWQFWRVAGPVTDYLMGWGDGIPLQECIELLLANGCANALRGKDMQNKPLHEVYEALWECLLPGQSATCVNLIDRITSLFLSIDGELLSGVQLEVGAIHYGARALLYSVNFPRVIEILPTETLEIEFSETLLPIAQRVAEMTLTQVSLLKTLEHPLATSLVKMAQKDRSIQFLKAPLEGYYAALFQRLLHRFRDQNPTKWNGRAAYGTKISPALILKQALVELDTHLTYVRQNKTLAPSYNELKGLFFNAAALDFWVGDKLLPQIEKIAAVVPLVLPPREQLADIHTFIWPKQVVLIGTLPANLSQEEHLKHHGYRADLSVFAVRKAIHDFCDRCGVEVVGMLPWFQEGDLAHVQPDLVCVQKIVSDWIFICLYDQLKAAHNQNQDIVERLNAAMRQLALAIKGPNFAHAFTIACLDAFPRVRDHTSVAKLIEGAVKKTLRDFQWSRPDSAEVPLKGVAPFVGQMVLPLIRRHLPQAKQEAVKRVSKLLPDGSEAIVERIAAPIFLPQNPVLTTAEGPLKTWTENLVNGLLTRLAATTKAYETAHSSYNIFLGTLTKAMEKTTELLTALHGKKNGQRFLQGVDISSVRHASLNQGQEEKWFKDLADDLLKMCGICQDEASKLPIPLSLDEQKKQFLKGLKMAFVELEDPKTIAHLVHQLNELSVAPSAPKKQSSGLSTASTTAISKGVAQRPAFNDAAKALLKEAKNWTPSMSVGPFGVIQAILERASQESGKMGNLFDNFDSILGLTGKETTLFVVFEHIAKKMLADVPQDFFQKLSEPPKETIESGIGHFFTYGTTSTKDPLANELCRLMAYESLRKALALFGVFIQQGLDKTNDWTRAALGETAATVKHKIEQGIWFVISQLIAVLLMLPVLTLNVSLCWLYRKEAEQIARGISPELIKTLVRSNVDAIREAIKNPPNSPRGAGA